MELFNDLPSMLSPSIVWPSLTCTQSPLNHRQTYKPLPGLIKNANRTIFIYGKDLILHFDCNSISTENSMEGLL